MAKPSELKQDFYPCEGAAQDIVDVNTGQVKIAVEKGASGSAELGATQSTNNSVKADAVKTFSAAGRAGNIR